MELKDKKLYMLIGPKGSGKTYIGTLLDKNSHIKFLNIENIWLSLKPSENGWIKVEESIHKAFSESDDLMIENLGAGVDFERFRNNLTKRYDVKLIKVTTDPSLCLERVQKRDNSNHIPVSYKMVVKYNMVASKVELDWDLVIDNNSTSDSGIIEKILSV